MNERVTDEWLRQQLELAELEGDKLCPDWASWSDVVTAMRLAFAQAVARECLRLCADESLVSRVENAISARFGLDD